MEDIIEYSTNVTMLIEGYSLDALIADKRTYIAVGTWGIVAVIPKYLLPLHPIIEIVPFS